MPNNFAYDAGLITVSGGTTSGPTPILVFSDSPTLTFGLDGATITASAAGGAGGGSVNFSAGTTSNNLGSVVFSNSNGLSFGLNGSTITGSVATSLTNVNLSAGTTSNNLSAFVFSNSNNISFGLNGSTITGTVTVATSLSNIRLSAGTTSNLASAFTFGDANGISFGLNAGTITGSHNGLTSQSNQNVTAGNGGFAFQTLSFSNVNGISFGTSAGSAITGSHNGLTTQTNQQMTLFATGNTTLSSTGTSNASSLIFRGSGAASIGITNGSVLIDVAAGAAAITQSIGMSTQTAGGATAGTAGYATGDDILYHFAAGSNITMSQSINGASGTLSIFGPAAGGGATISSYQNQQFFNVSIGVIGNSISFGNAFFLPVAGSFSFQRFIGSVSMFSTTVATLASATASAQAGQSNTINIVAYSMGSGASSKSLFSVASGSALWANSQRISITNSTQYSQSLGFTGQVEGASFTLSQSTARSTSNYSFSTGWMSNVSGARLVDTPFGTSLTPGNYWLIFGVSSSSTSAGAGLGGISACRANPFAFFAASRSNISFGIMNSTNITSGGHMEVGSFSTAGGGTTSGFHISAISSLASNPNFVFQLLRSV